MSKASNNPLSKWFSENIHILVIKCNGNYKIIIRKDLSDILIQKLFKYFDHGNYFCNFVENYKELNK